MRRRAAALVLAVLAAAGLIASCGAGGQSRVVLRAQAGHPHHFLTSACASTDCGPDAISLSWSTIPFAGTTGYNILLNGAQYDTTSGSPYLFTGMDCSTTFTLGVQAHNGSGGTSQTYTTSYTTPNCGSGPPVNTGAPATSGTAQQGLTLTASNGSWTNTPTSFTYQWQACTPTCSNITGATSSTYVAQASDAGQSDKLDVVVTAHNAAGAGSATSSQTATVGTMPANDGVDTSDPTICGSGCTTDTICASSCTFTAPHVITTAVSNTIFDVSGTISDGAVELGQGGSLTNVQVNYQVSGAAPSPTRTTDAGFAGIMSRCWDVPTATGCSSDQFLSMGTVDNVEVTGFTFGFFNMGTIAGSIYSTNNSCSCSPEGAGVFWHSDGGLTDPSSARIISDDDNLWGVQIIGGSTGLTFNGPIVANNEGSAGTIPTATGVDIGIGSSSENTNLTFTDPIVGTNNQGYTLEVYNSDHVNIGDVYASGNGDPAVSIGGGSFDNTIGNIAAVNVDSVGLMQGEDINPSPNNNTIHTLYVSGNDYPCADFDRGAYDETVGDQGGALCVGNGTSSPYLGAIFIANRSGQTGCANDGASCVEPYGNTVDGLYQKSGAFTPSNAVYFGPASGTQAFSGAAANTVTGHASSFSSNKVDDASCSIPPTTGPCGNNFSGVN